MGKKKDVAAVLVGVAEWLPVWKRAAHSVYSLCNFSPLNSLIGEGIFQ